MSILKNGTILNRNQYKITQFIAQGGFGITYLAEEIGFYKHSGFGEEYVEVRNPETVVIKELYYNDYCQRDDQTGLVSISNVDKKLEFQKLVKNQIDEGKTIRGLKHPNIVRTRDIFHENETAYMVMDYIESTDLEEMLKEKETLPKDQALRYIYQMLGAVDYIHTKIDKKILHLDISPSNILIDKNNDNAILIDFGSALSYDNVQNSITSTTSQIVTGRKKHYSPNEQGDIDNLKSFDATFDTYAIGATLYHLISGEKPPLSSLVSTGRMKITPPSDLRKDGEKMEYLDAIVMKSIAPMYKARYSSAAAFEKDLKQESAYHEDVKKIERFSADGESVKALNLILTSKSKYPMTPKLDILEKEIQKEVEKIEKEKEFKIFLNKGDSMLSANEFELALRFFTNAKEIFPNNKEVFEKINQCNEKLGKEKIDAPEDEKDETVLLQKPPKRDSQKVEKPKETLNNSENSFSGFENTFEGIGKKEEKVDPKSTPKIEEDATVLLSKPASKKADLPNEEIRPKTITPKPEVKKPEPNRPSKKSNHNFILIGSILGALILAGILFASGVFSSGSSQSDSIIPKDTLSDNSTNSIEMEESPTNSMVSDEISEPEQMVSTDEKTDWKTTFNANFNAIKNTENTASPSAVIAKYKNLLTTIPSNGAAERKKVNDRITAMNKILNSKNENSDWNTAKNKNTIASYNAYISEWTNGQYVSEARKRINDLTSKPEPKPTTDVDMDEYNKNLKWAKNMVSVDGCEGCKKNATCKSQVISRLQTALKSNPNGKEAKDLLNCLNN